MSDAWLRTWPEHSPLGQRQTTDVLLVSFSSPDLIGHGFGPFSQEIRDEYARLDRTIGSLMNDLDQLVGVGRYTLAFSADHGVTAIPEQGRAEGRDAGRMSAQGVTTAVEASRRRHPWPRTLRRACLWQRHLPASLVSGRG